MKSAVIKFKDSGSTLFFSPVRASEQGQSENSFQQSKRKESREQTLPQKKKNTTVYRDTSQPQDERLVECNLFVFKLNWKIMVHPPTTNVKQKSSKSSGCCKVIL